MLEKIFKKNTTLLYISTSIILLTILICILSQVYTKKLVDTDLKRKYNLDLVTSGNNVYHVERKTTIDKKGEKRIEDSNILTIK